MRGIEAKHLYLESDYNQNRGVFEIPIREVDFPNQT